MQGHIMQFCTPNGMPVKMAPLAKNELPKFIEQGGMQSLSATRYLAHRNAPTLEDEQDWFERVRSEADLVYWAIYVGVDDDWQLIGGSSIANIHTPLLKQATTGILLFDQSYWGYGIATACHKARTRYAFEELGIVCLRSAVVTANLRSAQAIERIGYCNVGYERNRGIHNGQRLHQVNYELINPAPWAWNAWWQGSRRPRKFVIARTRTVEALKWARRHVEYA